MFESGYSKIAYDIAKKAHKDQIDKAGKPYIEHPIYVAMQLYGDKLQAVALLHDVLEDSDFSVDDLVKSGLSDDIIESVKILYHKNDGLSYMEYVYKIKDSGNKMAIAVKKADLKHNMDISRIKYPSEQDFSRLKRYKKALKILEDS